MSNEEFNLITPPTFPSPEVLAQLPEGVLDWIFWAKETIEGVPVENATCNNVCGAGDCGSCHVVHN